MTEERIINEAQGYLELGLYEDAWEFIETQPPVIRMIRPLLRVRLLCAMGMRRFDMAETLALFVGDGTEQDKRLAGKILHELAAIHAIAGDLDKARSLVGQAVRIHPAQREAIIDDPTLEGLF